MSFTQYTSVQYASMQDRLCNTPAVIHPKKPLPRGDPLDSQITSQPLALFGFPGTAVGVGRIGLGDHRPAGLTKKLPRGIRGRTNAIEHISGLLTAIAAFLALAQGHDGFYPLS